MSSASATTYDLPANVGADPFNCTGTGPTYSCSGDVTIGGNDTINVTSPVTLNIGGDFGATNSLTISSSGNAFTLNIRGNFTVKNTASIDSAKIIAGGDVDLKNTPTLVGDITAGGNITLANNATVTGNLTAGGDITTGSDTNITGNVAAGGNLSVGGGTITGRCTYTTTNYICSSASPNHYELSLPSNSINCLATTVTVTACANASSPCTSAATSLNGKTATLATSGGSLGSTTVAFNSLGLATTTLSYPAAANGTSVSVTLSGEQTVATASRQCCPNGTSCSVANSCSTTFNTAGFIFSSTANGVAATIPAQSAGASSGTYYLRAVKTGSTTGVCTAALAGATTVNFAYQCNNPSTCNAVNLLSVNGGTATTVAGNPNSGVSTYTPVSMTFDGSGNAPFAFTYSDVGQVTLSATKTVGAATLSGSANAFVVKPYQFTLTNIRRSSDSFANPWASTYSGSAFMAAGSAFSATVTAATQGGAATPSFGLGTNNGTEAVSLAYTLQAPTGMCSGADCPATLSGTGATAPLYRSAFSSGVATVTDLSWSEVGIITLTASNSTFLGNILSTTGTSGNIGRFIPAYFTTSVIPGCSAFTYSGQALTVAVTAKNGGGTTTANYAGANWAKTVTLSDVAGSASGSLSGNTIAASSFASGTYSTMTPSYTFTSKSTAPTSITLRASDSDSVSSSGHAEGTASIYSGRLRLSNAYGSELLALTIPIYVEYYVSAASAWQTNASDTSCTALSAADFAFSFPATNANYTNNLTACRTAVSVSGSPPTQTITLYRPGSGYNGWTDLTLNLGASASGSTCATPNAGTGFSGPASTASKSWLQFNWTGTTGNPTARAFFGVRKSGPTIIQRELY